jgi:hypothetical protein
VVLAPGIAEGAFGCANSSDFPTFSELATCNGHHAGFSGGR